MSHRLIRYEKSKNWKGEDRVFCHVEVQTENDIYRNLGSKYKLCNELTIPNLDKQIKELKEYKFN